MPQADERSILAFSNFLKSAAGGVCLPSIALPIEHLVFYKRTIERLIEAGELPYEANERFDETFSSGFLKAFVS